MRQLPPILKSAKPVRSRDGGTNANPWHGTGTGKHIGVAVDQRTGTISISLAGLFWVTNRQIPTKATPDPVIHSLEMKQSLLIFLLAAGIIANGLCADPSATPLAGLAPDSNAQGWGTLQIDKAVSGSPLVIAGRTFTHGLGTHAASEIVYTLEDECETFTAWVGVDDHLKAHLDAKNASVVFQVIGDGKTLFESGIMRMGDAAKEVKVPLKGVTQLKLIVTDAGDGNSCDHADWADATLTGTAVPTTPAVIAHTVEACGFSLNLAKTGRIISGKIGNTGWPLSGDTRLRGFRPQGEAVVNSSLPNRALAFTRTLVDTKGHTCTVTDRFTPTLDSIRWGVEITSVGKPWSTTITTGFNYAATANSRFWTTWGHPDNDATAWADPLAWQPFANRTWGYQFPDWTQMGSTAKCNLSIPMFTVAEPGQDIALTFMQSPEDTLLDLSLSETSSGSIRFQRDNYRLGEGRTVTFHMDLAPHPADTRAGLGWVVARYPQFFNPGIPQADALSGSAAYSGSENAIDVAALKKMGFAYNWKLSDDFPYMGNFIPPVKNMDEKWTRSCAEPAPPGKGAETSCRLLNDYAKYMKDNGFHVLSYFNVTEYGKDMPWPVPPKQAKTAADLWKNPTDYLYHGGMEPAVLMNGEKPFYSNCYGAVIVDPGEPCYMNHIVEQVRRNNTLLPDVAGIGIDRLDWLGHYNERGDDGVSWVNDKPARSMFVSFQKLADQIVPELHQAGKVLFLNNCTPRIEIVGRGDGIFAEWASDMFCLPHYINYAALAGVRKPTNLWTAAGECTDFYFQRCLYLGVFPIAPYPNNNHCLSPSAEGQNMVKNMYAKGKDDEYIATPAAAASPEGMSIAYGPLFTAMRARKWVLAPHCVETTASGVKLNLFEVPGGYALPVTFGDKLESATVQVRNLTSLDKLKAAAIHPGAEHPQPVRTQFKDGILELTVPLKHGCALVQLILPK